MGERPDGSECSSAIGGLVSLGGGSDGKQRSAAMGTTNRRRRCGNCSDLQTSAVGIANIRPTDARSLQMALGHQPRIIATEPKLTANGIANIRIVRTLIATQTAVGV